MGNIISTHKIPTDILIFKYLPHGMLNLNIPNGHSSAKNFVLKSVQYIEALFDRKVITKSETYSPLSKQKQV